MGETHQVDKNKIVWEACFALKFRDKEIGIVQGAKVQLDDGFKFQCVQELYDCPELNVKKYKRASETLINAAGQPYQLAGKDSLGNEYLIAEQSIGNSDLVLEVSMIPQLAEAIARKWDDSTTIKLQTFLFESARILDMKLEQCGKNLWKSNINEELTIVCGDLTKLQTATPSIYFERLNNAHYQLPSEMSSFVGSPLSVDYIEKDWLNYRKCEIGKPKRRAMHVQGLGREMATSIFIGGSGQYDMNGRFSGKSLGYGELLDGLAQRGISSIRFDRLPVYDDRITTIDELVEVSMAAWKGLEKNDSNAPKLIIGHSLGGLIALKLAHQLEAIDGIVLIATPGRPIEDLVLEQFFQVTQEAGFSDDEVFEMSQKRDELIAYIKNYDSRQPLPPAYISYEPYREYLKQLLSLNPSEIIRSIQVPILIFSCEHDVQVPCSDVNRLANLASESGVTHKVIQLKSVNHILQRTQADEEFAIYHYFDEDRELDEASIDLVASEILELIRK